MFLELERIKKPSAAVLSIAKMACLFVEIVKEGESKEMDRVERLVTWSQIQDCVRENLTEKVNEIKSLLTSKFDSNQNPIELNRNLYFEQQFEILKETFFSG